MADYPPRLELELNKPVQVKFSFDKPLSGEGEYGTWYCYRVQAKVELPTGQAVWEDRSLFASQKLHALLHSLKVKKGSLATIEKKSAENEQKQLFSYYDVGYKGKVYDTKVIQLEEDELDTPTPFDKLKELPVPPDEPSPIKEKSEKSTTTNPIPKEYGALDIFSVCLSGAIGMLMDAWKDNGQQELPDDFVAKLYGIDGFWRCVNTLVMEQARIEQGRR